MFSCGGGQGVVGEGRPGGLFHGPIDPVLHSPTCTVHRGDDTIGRYGRHSYLVK